MLTSRRQQWAAEKVASGFATTDQWRCDELKVGCLFPCSDWMAEVGDLGGEGIASPSPLTLHDNSTSLKSAHILGSAKGVDSGRRVHRVGHQNKPIRSSGCERSGDAWWCWISSLSLIGCHRGSTRWAHRLEQRPLAELTIFPNTSPLPTWTEGALLSCFRVFCEYR